MESQIGRSMNKCLLPQDSEHEKLLRSMSESMMLFGKVCLPNMFSVKSPKFHYELIRAFSDKNRRKLNIIAPRGHAKSSLAACLWPLHHLFFDDGNKVIVLVSKTEGHANRLLQTIKNALDYSLTLRQIVGYWGEHSAKVWKSNEVVLKDGTMIITRGAGQMVVGLKHGDQRPTLVVLDDPEDMNNTKTSESMEWNLRWLLQALIPTLDPQRGRIAVIGTPQHQRCMVETLQSMDGWETLKYKAIQDDGTALWPEWWPIEKLLEEKRSLESINRVSSFYREYQCEIIGDEDQLFKENYFQYYDGVFEIDGHGNGTLRITELNGKKCEPQQIVPINVFMGIDPASSTAQTADYSTIVPIGVDKDKNRYILDYFRKRVTPLALADAIMHKFAIYRPQKTRIESVGYQEMLREYLREQADKRNIFIPGLEIKESPRTAKSHRIETLEPFFQQKKMYLKRSQQEMIDELLMYPRGKNDDLLDGLYYANKNVFIPNHEFEETHQILRGRPELDEDWMLS